MLPDVGAGNTLTHIWWLSLVVLFICTVASGSAVTYVAVHLQRRGHADETRNRTIADLQAEFHKCQVHCANHRGNVVSRDDFDARMLRFEEAIGKLYGICDSTNIKVGKIEGAMSSGTWLKPDTQRNSE